MSERDSSVRMGRSAAICSIVGALAACAPSGDSDVAAAAADALAVSIDSGATYTIVGVESGKCLRPANGNSAASVVIAPCDGSSAEQYQLTAASTGAYSIKNVGTGLCLDVAQASTSDGGQLIQYRCTGADNQLFAPQASSANAVKLMAKHSGKYLELHNHATADGSNVVQWTENGATSQQFKLVAMSADGGAGGADGGSGACRFASGLNVAWVNFANDVPNPDLNAFNTIFRQTYGAGGRIVRWWFHTNGAVTPGYQSNGLAQKLPQSHIDGVKAILNAAHASGVAVIISLWSFDMLQSNAGAAHTNNQLLLENDTNRQAYIDNYLTPLVTALKGTPGLYSYEIFNEPEGMGPNGWATYRTTQAAIQKTVNWLAAAIHTADPSVPVTNGAVTFDYCSNVIFKNNYYSDAALRSVGGRQNGTLDYYEVHYYKSNGTSNSCFLHPASYWKLDKKLVVGEFAAAATDGVAQDDLYTSIYNGGYDGAWAWAYGVDWPWPAMQTAMQNVYNAHSNDIASCR